MKIENVSKVIKLYEDYQVLDNLLKILQTNKYKIKISAINSEFGFYDQERVIITPNSDLYNKIIDTIKIKRDSIGDEINKL